MRTADLWRRLRIVGAVECGKFAVGGTASGSDRKRGQCTPRDIFQDFGLPKMHTIRHYIGPRTGIFAFLPILILSNRS